MEVTKYDFIVVGAGLTGLTTAFYLQKAGKRVLLLERDERAGGVIKTHNENGFLFESGPNTGVIGTPELVQLFDDLSETVVVETPKAEAEQRWIFKNGKWNALPSGLLSAISTPLFTFKDKFNILLEPFRKRGQNPNESVADLVVRRLGKSYLDYAVDPFISGIYAGNPSQLVTRFALPKLYQLEQNYGSFIIGSIKKGKLPKSELEKRVNRKVFSIVGGLQKLIDALVGAIGDENIRLGCLNVTIHPIDSGFNCDYSTSTGELVKLSANEVITTVTANQLPSILPFINKGQMDAIASTLYAKVVQVVVGYKVWNGKKLNAFGGLTPSKEGRKVLGILFPSSLFNGRAPQNGALMSLFLGGMKKPELINLSDEKIIEMALEEIRATLHSDKKPDLIRVFRYQNAIPQYDISTEKRIAVVAELHAQYPHLHLSGNMLDGIGMADRVAQARKLANRLTQ